MNKTISVSLTATLDVDGNLYTLSTEMNVDADVTRIDIATDLRDCLERWRDEWRWHHDVSLEGEGR